MAKKRFTDGLDSLFGSSEEQNQETLSLFPEENVTGVAKRDDEKKSSKGFASQLDAFLAEAFESEEDKAETKAEKKKPKRRLAGLDLLIQKTAEAPPKSRSKLVDKRRLTLAFDKKQLTALKGIAEKEGVYLKDLIAQLIERYLSERDK